jgi:LPS export ABC transporter protein LptC
MKIKFFFFFSLALSLAVLIILGYKETDVTVAPLYKTSSMQGLHITHKTGGRIKWELTAKDANFPSGNKEVIIRSLKLKIYNDPEIYLTGGSGIYKIEGENLTINKPVEINIRDAKFTTDSLTWDSGSELITTKDNIRFTGKNFLIEGEGLVAKTKEQKMKILSNVKGIFYL